MDSDSDADILDDLNICVESTYARKVKLYRKRINPFEFYSDEEFQSFYRFDKETARNIVQMLREDLNHNSSQGAPISPEIMVMATIRYIAKGAYQTDIAEVHGISQQSMTEIIRKVTTELANKMKNFINFPTSFQELQKLKNGFYRIARFPQVIGAIDCTHFKIKNPGGKSEGAIGTKKDFVH